MIFPMSQEYRDRCTCIRHFEWTRKPRFDLSFWMESKTNLRSFFFPDDEKLYYDSAHEYLHACDITHANRSHDVQAPWSSQKLPESSKRLDSPKAPRGFLPEAPRSFRRLQKLPDAQRLPEASVHIFIIFYLYFIYILSYTLSYILSIFLLYFIPFVNWKF